VETAAAYRSPNSCSEYDALSPKHHRRGHASRNPQIAEEIARTAARLMAEEGVRDFATAKRKAADRLNVAPNRNLPSNVEIEQALVEYQRLFRADIQPRELDHLRHAALQAMRLLERFEPRLVGPVLAGTADVHYPVTLHLFTDTPEEVDWFLLERRIPFELDERQLKPRVGQTAQYPLYRFVAGDTTIELTVFPTDGLRQAPLSPVDGRPMERATLRSVEALLA